MAKVGDGYVEVKPDTDKFGAWLKAKMASVDGEANKAGRNTGLRFGNAMQTGIASSLGRTGGLVALGAVMAGPLAAATSGIAGGLTAVGAAAAYAGGAAASAVPLYLALGQGFGVAKLATAGMSDAFKEAFKAQATLAAGEKLTKAEQEKLTASMKNLAPAARSVVGETLKLYPAFQKLKMGVQQRAFVGLAGVMKTTATRFLPLLTQQLNITATTGNRIVKSFARVNTTAHAMNTWGKIANANNVILRSLGAAGVQAFSGVREAIVPLLPFGVRLAGSITRVATAFNKWATSVKGQNQITNFMRAAWVSAKLLLSIAKNLAVALGNIFKQGKGTGDSLLKTVDSLTAKFAAWTSSMAGKNALQRWFAEGKQTLIQVGGLVGDIARAFGQLSGTADPSDTVKNLRAALQPVLQLLQQINASGVGQQVIQGFTQIAAALQQMNAGGAISSFISSLVSMTQALANFVTSIPGGTQAVAGIATTLGTLAAIRFVGSVTGVTQLGMAIGKLGAAGIKSQGGISGLFDTIRLKGMYAADAMRGVGAKMASGLQTAWTGIGVGAINAQSKLTKFGYTVQETFLQLGSKIGAGVRTAGSAISTFASNAARTGASIGASMGRGAATAASALGRYGAALGRSAAFGAQVVSMNARVGASLLLMATRSALATAKTLVVRAAMAAWVPIQWALNAAMSANPIGLVVAALALLAAGIYLAWTRSATFRTVVMAVWGAIRGFVVGSVQAIWAVIQAVWGAIGPYVMTVVRGIGVVVKTYFTIMVAIIRAALTVIGAVVRAGFTIVKTIIMTVVRVVKALITGDFGAIKGIILNAVRASQAAVSGAFNTIRSAVSSAMSTVGSAISKAWSAAVNAFKTGVSRSVEMVKSLKGKVLGALSGAASWLLSAGADLIRGLINGITSMAGQVAGKAKEVVSGAINAAKNALKIGSPSRVFMVIGRQTIQGFVIGLDDGAASARKATEALMSKVIDAANKAYGTKGITAAQKRAILAQRNRLLSYIQTVYDKTVAPTAKKMDALAASITKTTANIKAMQEARAQVANSIRDTALDARNLFGNSFQDVAATPAAIIKQLQTNLTQLNQFRTKLAQLAKRGLNSDVINQIASQGAAAGTAVADALLKATPAQLKTLNSTYTQIGNAAGALGNTVAGSMYDAGIKSAQGLLAGLQSQRAKLVNYLASIAQQMVAALKKTLKIKSPSRVMQDIGVNTGAGLALGLTKSQSLVDKAQLQLGTGLLGTGTPLPAGFGPQLSIGQLRVFIGDKEITEIARTEVKAANTKLADKTLRRTTV